MDLADYSFDFKILFLIAMYAAVFLNAGKPVHKKDDKNHKRCSRVQH
jgi:hypothetical protein